MDTTEYQTHTKEFKLGALKLGGPMLPVMAQRPHAVMSSEAAPIVMPCLQKDAAPQVASALLLTWRSSSASTDCRSARGWIVLRLY